MPISVQGRHWIDETRGHATVLITPMTLAPSDSLDVIERVARDRARIVFGEEVPGTTRGLEVVAGRDLAAVRRISDVLRSGGVLCTYPDFVYAGHASSPMELFGTVRPIASGFVGLVSRPGTMLLPLACHRVDAGIEVRAAEPWLVESAEGVDRAHGRAVATRAVARILESVISDAPTQWCLLPTLSFSSPQASDGRARSVAEPVPPG